MCGQDLSLALAIVNFDWPIFDWSNLIGHVIAGFIKA